MQITAALALAGQKEFSLQQAKLAKPNADEILVEIAGVGICHTDLVVRDAVEMIFAGSAVLGHEGAGKVIEIGANVTKVAVGDHVALTFRSCGKCGNCSTGPSSYCEDFNALNMSGCRSDGTKAHSTADGDVAGNFFGQSSFATHCLAYESGVVKLPDGISAELAGPLGCSVQTGAGGILNSLDPRAGSSLVVIGGGPVGQSAVMAGKLRGCDPIILIEPQAPRREFALAHGATHCIDPMAESDLEAAIRAIVPGGLEYAFDTTAIESVLGPVISALKIKGSIGLVGLSQSDASMPLKANQFSAKGIRVIGIIEGDSDPDEFLPFLMDQHLAGNLPFDDMIQTYPLDQINRAIEEQHRGACIKAVLIP